MATPFLLVAQPSNAQDNASNGPKIPGWARIHGEVGPRFERVEGVVEGEPSQDSFVLSRARLDLTLMTPHSRFRAFVQVQDSHAPGFREPVPGNVVNRIDLNQAYVELGLTAAADWTLRLGRQELSFGDERLIGSGPWSNVPRRFDAIRLSRNGGIARLDFFAAAVVTPADRRFDRSFPGGRLYGAYTSFGAPSGPAMIEPFLLIRQDARSRAPLGGLETVRVYTPGGEGRGQARRR